MKKLYIIGNGFDQYHDLPTSFKCFNCFMCREHPEIHKRIGGIFDTSNPNSLWSHFEKKLGELDVLGLVSRNLPWWADTKNRKEFSNSFDTLHMDLVGHFHDWATKIDMSCANSKRLELDRNAYYINFNYTFTLEEKKGLYQIPKDHICYIHGDTCDNNFRQPITGHGNVEYENLINEKEIRNIIGNSHKLPIWVNTIDDFVEEIVYEIKELLRGLKKDTNGVLGDYDIKKFIEERTKSEEIYVLGHSLAEVDLPYFERIAQDSRNANWYASYNVDNAEKDKKAIENMRKVCGIDHIELITLDDLLKRG